MIKRVSWTAIWFNDVNGDRRELRGLPLARRRRFVELQELAGAIITEHPDCSIGFLYDHDTHFAAAIDECLSLYGLSPDWCSAAQVMQLFFAYEGKAGLCWQLEFPDKGEKKGQLLKDADPYHNAIAAVWSYSPELSLAEVIDSIAEVPWSDIEGILAERNRMEEEADPQYAKKQAEKEQMDRLTRAFEEDADSLFAIAG